MLLYYNYPHFFS